jgi:epoxyqueuosine reductase
MKESILPAILKILSKEHSCCQFASVPIHSLSTREKGFFRLFMPEARSAIVVNHHILTMKEWTWYQPLEGCERCEADDHVFDVCLKIKDVLRTHGYQSKIVPYPGESGLQFRYVAQSAGVGKIGKNAFLLHPTWGPWVHLRVIATTAPTAKLHFVAQKHQDVCGDCTRCIDSCPAKAFTDGFDGLVCRKYREEKGEYNPIGNERVYRWCEKCALVCPLGKKPEGDSP